MDPEDKVVQMQYSRDPMEETEEAAARAEEELKAPRGIPVNTEGCGWSHPPEPEPEPEPRRFGSAEELEEAFLSGIRSSLPEPRSVLRIAPHGERDVMRIESPYPFPGRIRRLLYWVLLGWRWERP